MPLSAVVSSREILGVFTPGSHGSTFSGNPLACAIGSEVIKIVKEEGFEKKSAELGDYLQHALQGEKLSKVKEIRGRGLFIGIDIHPSFGKAKEICAALQAEGVLCKDTRDYSIRIAPPLVITKVEVDWALQRLVKVLS